MPANVAVVNGVASIAYTGATPWHGLGTYLDHPMDWEEAYVKGGLNYEIDLRPSGWDGGGQFHAVPDTFHVVRTDNLITLGTVGKNYTIIQNRDLFSIFNAVVREQLMTFEVVGALKQGQVVWILAKLPGYIKVKGDDMVNKYVLLASSHDGSLSVIMLITPIRVVCQNTLVMAINSAERKFSAKHTKSVVTKISEIRNTLGLYNEWFDRDFAQMTQKLVSTQVTTAKLDTFLMDMGFGGESKKALGIREDVTRLFETGRGNNVPGIKGTAWALLNGVTEFVDWERSTKVQSGSQSTEESRLYSAWFGQGKDHKVKALELALNL